MRNFTLSIVCLIFVVFIISCGSRNNEESAEKRLAPIDSLVPKNVTLNDKKRVRVCTQMLKKTAVSHMTKGAFGYDDLFFPDSTSVLKIQFIDGNIAIQAKVQASAKLWEPHCGIKFQFGKFAKPDITISFIDIGSWSYVGLDSRNHIPSMNFGWFDDSTSIQEYDRVVLHEFGHALGLYHEHQTPLNNPIDWDTAAVLSYYTGPPNNWKEADVYADVINVESSTHFKGTAFDKYSIMLYDTPIEFTHGFHSQPNYKLSKGDISFIKTIYNN